MQENVIKSIADSLDKQDLLHFASKLNISEAGVETYLKSYTQQDVLKACEFTVKKIEHGMKITNVAGYIWKLLEQGIVEEVSEDEQQQQKDAQFQMLLSEKITTFNQLPHPVKIFFDKFAELYQYPFVNLISCLEFIEYTDNVLSLEAPNAFMWEWIPNNYRTQMHHCGRIMDPDFKEVRIYYKGKY